MITELFFQEGSISFWRMNKELDKKTNRARTLIYIPYIIRADGVKDFLDCPFNLIVHRYGFKEGKNCIYTGDRKYLASKLSEIIHRKDYLETSEGTVREDFKLEPIEESNRFVYSCKQRGIDVKCEAKLDKIENDLMQHYVRKIITDTVTYGTYEGNKTNADQFLSKTYQYETENHNFEISYSKTNPFIPFIHNVLNLALGVSDTILTKKEIVNNQRSETYQDWGSFA